MYIVRDQKNEYQQQPHTQATGKGQHSHRKTELAKALKVSGVGPNPCLYHVALLPRKDPNREGGSVMLPSTMVGLEKRDSNHVHDKTTATNM